MKPITAAVEVRNPKASGNYLLFSAAQIMRPTIRKPRLPAASGVLIRGRRLAGNEATNTQLPLAVSATCQWQLPAVFGGADNEANNTAAVATGGVNNSASGVYSSVVGGLRNEAAILPQAVGGVRNCQWQLLCCFRRAQIMSQQYRRGYLAVSITLPVCTHPWSAHLRTKPPLLLAVSATPPVVYSAVSAAQIMRPTIRRGYRRCQ
jgi:hypothetical protein